MIKIKGKTKIFDRNRSSEAFSTLEFLNLLKTVFSSYFYGIPNKQIMIFVLNINKLCLIVHNFLSKLAEIVENSFKIFFNAYLSTRRYASNASPF